MDPNPGYRVPHNRDEAVNAWKVCYFNNIPACNYKPDYTATWPQIILPQGVCVYVGLRATAKAFQDQRLNFWTGYGGKVDSWN
jgi:hypothetical protein